MKDEMKALERNATWDLIKLPRDRKIVGCKWVYKINKGVDDKVERYKARLVAKRYSQKEDIDFHDIFSPFVKIVSIRSVLALVALIDLELEHLDVKTTFLHGDLDEEIYMEQPEGFVQNCNNKFVCRIKKSLYGLRQSLRQWYKKFDSFMVSQNYTRIEYDHSVYFKKLNNGIFIVLLLYVDDMILAIKIITEINRLNAHMARTFNMKDLGAARKILGMEIFRDRRNGKIWLSQQKYVEKILLRFGMNDVKLVSIPLASHFKLSSSLCPSTKEENEYMSRIPYANAVGSLMYAMVSTRPDISHAVGVVSRYMENPGKEHWATMKWVLRYLRGTSDYCITYNSGCELVCGYVDSNFAGDLNKRILTSECLFTLVGGDISWMSNLQNIISLSATEAEYVAASHACKEAIWLKGLFGEFGRMQDKVRLLCDSQSTIHSAKNPAYHSKTKHIPIKYHFVR
jgi:hypothetical protein